MKLLPLLCAVAFACAPLAVAQDTPQYELFGGGALLRVHATGAEATQLTGLPDIQIDQRNWNFNLYGWDTNFTENLNHWFGGELDFSGFYGSPGATFLYPASQIVSPTPNTSATVPVQTREETYMFGPRFQHRSGPLVLFVHALAGAASIHTSLNESAIVSSDFAELPPGRLAAKTSVALSPGVGIDLRLNDRLSIRIVQVDYLSTHYWGSRQDNARATTGLIFNFGETKR